MDVSKSKEECNVFEKEIHNPTNWDYLHLGVVVSTVCW